MFSSSTWDTQRMHCNTRRDFQNDHKLRFEKSLERYLKTQHRFELSCLTVALQDMSITPSATSNHSSPSVGLGQTPLSSQSSFVRPLQSNSWFQSASRSIWSSGWKKTHTQQVQQQSAAHTSAALKLLMNDTDVSTRLRVVFNTKYGFSSLENKNWGEYLPTFKSQWEIIVYIFQMSLSGFFWTAVFCSNIQHQPQLFLGGWCPEPGFFWAGSGSQRR